MTLRPGFPFPQLCTTLALTVKSIKSSRPDTNGQGSEYQPSKHNSGYWKSGPTCICTEHIRNILDPVGRVYQSTLHGISTSSLHCCSNYRLKGTSELRVGTFTFHRHQQREMQIPTSETEGKPVRTESAVINYMTHAQNGRGLSSLSLLVVSNLPPTQRSEPWGVQ